MTPPSVSRSYSRLGAAGRIGSGALLAVLATVTLGAAGVPEFHVSPVPPADCPQPGDTFVVLLSVDPTAEQFNAYEVVLSFAPEIIRLDAIVSGQLFDVEGCGPPFFDPTVDESMGSVVHSLLCAGVSVDGPGVLSAWFFTALAPGVSPLTFETDPDRMFADAGLWVWPGHPTFPRQVVATDGVVEVCEVIGVDDADGVASPPRVWPNPWSGPGVARLSLDAGGVPGRVELFGVDGRSLWEVTTRGDQRTIRLPSLPPGVYLYRVTQGAESRMGRLTRIP
jgi:hypothetical protein